ncbi:MAG: histidine kinase [Oscillospiraceae bacterium]|nr:histidine kinase [Oscillospiraceae bacterium]
MQEFLQTNYMTFLLLVALVVIMAVNHKNRIPASRLFHEAMLLMGLLLVGEYIEWHGFDMVARHLDLAEAIHLRTVGSVICYVLRPVIVMLELLIISPSRRISMACTVPSLVNAGVYIPALFGSRLAFYIDEQGQFCEGKLYYVNFAVLLTYILLLLLFSLSYFRKQNIKQAVIILLILVESVSDAVCEFLNVIRGYPTAVMALCMLEYYIYLILIYQHDIRETLAEQRLRTEKTNRLLMLSQIQPHFLFNALNTIRALYAKDPPLGEQTLEHFSTYLRQNLEALSQTELIPFERELEHTRLYTEIELHRFPEIRIQYQIGDTDFLIPTLTVQPLVENAIRHGVRGRKNGLVTVTAMRDAQTCRITVEDNGAGFDPEQLKDSEGTHIGLQSVKERVEQMCHGTMTVKSERGAGTKITLLIPVRPEYNIKEKQR